MSTNTIKLASNTGDIYVAPQQTTTYKGIELFGYGYLDWGRITNQSLVRLIDLIDALQDSGSSEFEFQLEEYTLEQDARRTEEFNIWKENFRTILMELVNGYTSSVNEKIELLKETQDETIRLLKEELETEIESISTDLEELESNFENRVTQIINSQLESALSNISALTNSVNQALLDIKDAETSLNKATMKIENALTTFKEELNIAFSTFKDETSNALEENKNYLIEYINTKIAGTNSISTSLSDRISTLELISETMSPDNINTIIISRINTLASSIITDQLGTFILRISSIETAISNLTSGIDEKIQDALDNFAVEELNEIKNTQVSHNALIGQIKTRNDSNFEWIDQFESNIEERFYSYENFFPAIDSTFTDARDAINLIGANEIRNKLRFKALLEKIITQNNKLTNNIILGHQEKLKSLISGLGYTGFNELSLIQNYENFNNIKLQGNIEFSGLDIIKKDTSSLTFTDFTFLPEIKSLNLGFKLPISFINNNNFKILIERINSSGNIVKSFEQSIYLIEEHAPKNGADKYFGIENSMFQSPNLDIIWYSKKFNCSNSFSVFNLDYVVSDKLKFTFKNNLGTEIIKEILISEVYNDSDYTEALDNKISELLYNISETMDSSVANILNNPILPNINHTINSTKLMIPLCKISDRVDGTKELLIKIKLPTGATLTKITFNDGFNDQTKNFVNHDIFPISLTEYTSRNLQNTENYYKDICSTGVLDYQINSSSVSVTGVCTYVVSGTTKTINFSTDSGSGSGSDTTIVNNYNYETDVKLLSGANTLNLADSDLFVKTLTSNITFNVAGIKPSPKVNSFALEIKNNSNYTITWWNNIKWPGGTIPQVAQNTTDIFGFYSYDGGSTWKGIILGKDIK